MPLPKKRLILRCRIKRMITIEHGCINAISVGSSMTTYIAYLLCHHRARGQAYVELSAEEPVAFFVMPWTCLFTDKGIQAYRLKESTAALGQSAVRRHTRAFVVVVVVVVVVYPIRVIQKHPALMIW